MDHDLLDVKLNQLVHVLRETEGWLAVQADEFGRDIKLVRACQRNLQLLVEYASDVNGILALEFGKKVPGSYRESFATVFAMDPLTRVSAEDRVALFASVDWRNDLIHEYEPAASNDVFYTKLQEFLIAYRNYARAIRDRFNPSG